MSKKSVQKRVAAKRERERLERRRQQRTKRMRRGTVMLSGGAVLALITFFAFGAIRGAPEAKNSASPSPSPTATGSGTPCVGASPGPYTGKTYSAYPATVTDAKKKYAVTMVTTCGEIKMTLDPSLAPKAVNNFVFLAQEGFYDNTKIHRLVNNPGAEAIMQGGDPKGDGTGGPGYQFTVEKPKDGSKYARGTLAMANSGTADSNGSQFFIVDRDWTGLPLDYTIFGSVTDAASLAVLDKIVQVPGTPLPGGLGTGPEPPIYILKVTVAAI